MLSSCFEGEQQEKADLTGEVASRQESRPSQRDLLTP